MPRYSLLAVSAGPLVWGNATIYNGLDQYKMLFKLFLVIELGIRGFNVPFRLKHGSVSMAQLSLPGRFTSSREL
jgi:hypothetical protein